MTVQNLDQGPMERFLLRLMSTSALVAPRLMSPYDNFGVIAAGQVGERAKAPPRAGFSVREARDRIVDFLNGNFVPKTLVELLDYLSERFMHLELRVSDAGVANYLVDRSTKKAVPASQVDARLSRPALARKFGEAVLADPRAKKAVPLTQEEVFARNLRARISARLADFGQQGPMFRDWDDMAFSGSATFQGREFTAQGDEIWLGIEFGRAVADPAENLKLMEKAQAEGIKLILPAETPELAREGKLVPGMPILVRRGAVRSRLIDPSLSLASLTKTFGVDPYAHFREVDARLASRVAPAKNAMRSGKVVSIQAFRKPSKPIVTAAPVSKVKPLTADKIARSVVRHEFDENGREILSFVNPDDGSTYPFEINADLVGVYRKEDSFGLPTGYIKINADGGYVHLNAQEREHNPYGPAVVEPLGSGRQSVFALEGERLSAKAFSQRTGIGLKPVASVKGPTPDEDVSREAPDAKTPVKTSVLRRVVQEPVVDEAPVVRRERSQFFVKRSQIKPRGLGGAEVDGMEMGLRRSI